MRLSHLFDNVPLIASSWNFQELSPLTDVKSMQEVQIRCQSSRSQTSWPHLSRFRTVTPVWIHIWQSLMLKGGALLFFKVIRQISRSCGTKYRQICPGLSVSGPLLRLELTNGFEMMHKAWCSKEEVPYGFSRSSITFQGHTGWKIDDLNPIWDY